MWRFVMISAAVLFGFQAQALTFKSGQSLSSEDLSPAVKITEEDIAACRESGSLATGSDTMQVMSFNIRYDNSGDGSNQWSKRTGKVASIFETHDVDLGGLQEVLHNQFEWLQANLTEYSFVGVGRDDGKTEGEYAPIFYRTSDFDLIKTETIWLSQTPDKPGSKGWDAALPRIATFAILRHKASDTQILLGSAHYDHRGSRAKRNSGEVIHNYITNLLKTEDLPLIILTGDFNDRPDSSTTRAIENINCLFDTRRMASEPEGPNSTWNGFRSVAAYERIDYIFANPAVAVKRHVTDDRKIDGRFPSDHLPVIVTMAAPE